MSDWLKSHYDAECDALRSTLRAAGVVAIVIEGTRGTDIAVRAPEKLLPHIPALLRQFADAFEEQYKRIHGPQICCPECKMIFVDAVPVNADGATPSAGDHIICAKCAAFLRFTSATQLRLATTEEIAHMPDDIRMALVRARREIERRRR